MTLTLNQWNESLFQIAVANACSEFFCKSGTCTSPSGRAKRSEKGAYFEPSDVIVFSGTSFANALNSFIVEFAVLFPFDDAGKEPKVTPAKDIIQMVKENKQSIEKDVGGTIQSYILKVEDRPTGSKSTDKNEPSVRPIAAGAGVTFVVMGMLMAFIVYRMRRKYKRKPEDRKTAAEFENPPYDEPIYDVIPENTGNSAAETLPQVTDLGRQAIDIYGEETNASTESVLRSQSSSKQYAVPRGSRENGYASLFRAGRVDQGLKQSKGKAKNEENYMMLAVKNAQGKFASDGTLLDEKRYMRPVFGRYAIPRADAAKRDEEPVERNYENTQYNGANYQDKNTRDKSGANSDDEDYMRPVDWHYAVPKHNRATENTIKERPFLKESHV